MTRQDKAPLPELWRTDALVPRLEAFIAGKTGRRARISDVQRYTVGLSWVTMRLIVRLPDDETLDLILRIGGPNGLLAPYSARPEFTALCALDGVAGLPIPRALWFSDDPEILGAPFLITERVAGDTPSPPWGREITLSRTHDMLAMERDFADALAAIHTFDWRASDLASLDPDVTPETATLHELDRWAVRAHRPGEPPIPALHLTERWLRANVPATCDLRLVHGDYRVGNFLAEGGRITAILDWELVHLGDPLEDLSWMGLRIFGGSGGVIGGLFDREAVLARYAASTGIEIDRDRLAYYDVLSLYKCAIVVECARQRTRSGHVHDARIISSGLQMPSTLMGMLGMLKGPL